MVFIYENNGKQTPWPNRLPDFPPEAATAVLMMMMMMMMVMTMVHDDDDDDDGELRSKFMLVQ